MTYGHLGGITTGRQGSMISKKKTNNKKRDRSWDSEADEERKRSARSGGSRSGSIQSAYDKYNLINEIATPSLKPSHTTSKLHANSKFEESDGPHSESKN